MVAPRIHGLQTSRGLFCVQPGHTRSSGNGPFSLDIATSAGKQRPGPPRFRRWSRNALNFGFEPAGCKAAALATSEAAGSSSRGGGWPLSVARPLPLRVSSRPEPPGAPERGTEFKHLHGGKGGGRACDHAVGAAVEVQHQRRRARDAVAHRTAPAAAAARPTAPPAAAAAAAGSRVDGDGRADAVALERLEERRIVVEREGGGPVDEHVPHHVLVVKARRVRL